MQQDLRKTKLNFLIKFDTLINFLGAKNGDITKKTSGPSTYLISIRSEYFMSKYGKLP